MNKINLMNLFMLIAVIQLALCTTASADTIIVDEAGGGDTTSLKTAISVAKAGDTIVVRGACHENLDVTGKNLKAVKGEVGSSPTIHGSCTVTDVDNVEISGLTFMCISEDSRLSGNNLTIENNIIISNGVNYIVTGDNIKFCNNTMTSVTMYLYGNDCILANNSGTATTISARSGARNIIEKNVISGISSYSSHDCRIIDNVIHHDIEKSAVRLSKVENCLIKDNIIRTQKHHFLSDKIGIEICSDSSANISDNVISGFACGISSNGQVKINYNTIVYCDTGIILRKFITNNALVAHNILKFNIRGIAVYSGKPKIYLNSLSGNYLDNAVSTSSDFAWDNGEKGNYWDNYNGEDFDGDGIGDKSYIDIGANCTDHYPLMEEPSNCGSKKLMPAPPSITISELIAGSTPGASASRTSEDYEPTPVQTRMASTASTPDKADELCDDVIEGCKHEIDEFGKMLGMNLSKLYEQN